MKKPETQTSGQSRREFIKNAAIASSFFIVPRHVLGGVGGVHGGVLLGRGVDVDGLAVDELCMVGTTQVDGCLCPGCTSGDLHMGSGQGV